MFPSNRPVLFEVVGYYGRQDRPVEMMPMEPEHVIGRREVSENGKAERISFRHRYVVHESILMPDPDAGNAMAFCNPGRYGLEIGNDKVETGSIERSNIPAEFHKIELCRCLQIFEPAFPCNESQPATDCVGVENLHLLNQVRNSPAEKNMDIVSQPLQIFYHFSGAAYVAVTGSLHTV